jgi:hypothetical protein
MAIQAAAEQEFLVGAPIVLEGASPDGRFMAVFEDDGDTGYFYALDRGEAENPLKDAVHIYNAADVTDREHPACAVIGWSLDNKKVVLLINDYPHAIFDFEARQGYCRTGFPPPNRNGDWSKEGHSWSESAIELFT